MDGIGAKGGEKWNKMSMWLQNEAIELDVNHSESLLFKVLSSYKTNVMKNVKRDLKALCVSCERI